jgi:two-component system sensor histidine kinase/response regulator
MSKRFKLFVLFLSFASLLSLSAYFVDHFYFSGEIKKVALDNAVEKSKEREEVLKEFLSHANDMLVSIEKMETFQGYLRDTSGKDILKEFFLATIKSHENIMQLRYIDKNGFEKIRVDRDKSHPVPYVVGENNLQDKSNRYYFSESKNKQLGEVWFSALDLNIEHGKVEIPYRPTLRAMLPIKHDEEFDGVLIINYLMQDFLSSFMKTPLYDMILSNGKGFPLIHHNPCKNWGYYSANQFNLQTEFPNSFHEIFKHPILHTNDFVSKKLDVPILGDLYLILQVNQKYLAQQEEKIFQKHLLIALFVFIFAIFISFLIVRIFSKTILDLEQTQALVKALHIKEKELNDYITSSSDFVWEVDAQGRYTKVSDGAFSILGYSQDEIIGKTPFEFMLEEDVQNISNKFIETVRKKWPIIELENWNLAKNGEKKCLITNGVPFFDENGIFLGYRGTDRDATELYNMRQELDQQTYYDKLTNLPNRLLFNDRLTEHLKRARVLQKQSAVILLDIDHIKSINDSFGHESGDLAIGQFAKLLQSCLKEQNTLSRFGGRCFCHTH